MKGVMRSVTSEDNGAATNSEETSAEKSGPTLRTDRPDFSEYVAHFTTNRNPYGLNVSPGSAELSAIATLTAYERLVSILEDKTVKATPMPWTNRLAAAFTECPWGSLLRHAERYSAFGVGFRKAHLFWQRGGPAIYLKPDLFLQQHEHHEAAGGPPDSGFAAAIWAFVTPFVPVYAPPSYRSSYWDGKPPVLDFTPEREWRVPGNFTFEYTDIEFVVVEKYEQMARLPKYLKDGIGREKFLMMDVYREIHRRWPIV